MEKYDIYDIFNRFTGNKDTEWHQKYEALDLCGGNLTAMTEDDEDMLEIHYPDGSMIDVGFIADHEMYYITVVKDDSLDSWNEPLEIIEVSEKSMLAYELQSTIYRNYKTNHYETPLSAHRHSANNRKMLSTTQKCGCFYCLKTFDSRMIDMWTDNGETAHCPYCNVDSVIGESSGVPLTENFLQEMNEYWF